MAQRLNRGVKFFVRNDYVPCVSVDRFIFILSPLSIIPPAKEMQAAFKTSIQIGQIGGLSLKLAAPTPSSSIKAIMN
jgi:hypothetical protein